RAYPPHPQLQVRRASSSAHGAAADPENRFLATHVLPAKTLSPPALSVLAAVQSYGLWAAVFVRRLCGRSLYASRMLPTRSSTSSSIAPTATALPPSSVTSARWLLLRRIRDKASASGNDLGTCGSGRTNAGSITACGSSLSVNTSLMCR